MPTIQEAANKIVFSPVHEASSLLPFRSTAVLTTALELANRARKQFIQMLISAELRKRKEEEGQP